MGANKYLFWVTACNWFFHKYFCPDAVVFPDFFSVVTAALNNDCVFIESNDLCVDIGTQS